MTMTTHNTAPVAMAPMRMSAAVAAGNAGDLESGSGSTSTSQAAQQQQQPQGFLARLRGGAHPIAECLACCICCCAAEDIAACLCLDSICFCCSEA